MYPNKYHPARRYNAQPQDILVSSSKGTRAAESGTTGRRTKSYVQHLTSTRIHPSTPSHRTWHCFCVGCEKSLPHSKTKKCSPHATFCWGNTNPSSCTQ